MNNLFGKCKGKGAEEGANIGNSRNPTKHMRELFSRQQDVNKDVEKLSKHEVMSTRWRCDTILIECGLFSDLDWMASNSGMSLFIHMYAKTYKKLTLEFLATFQDKLKQEGANPACNFTIQGEFHDVPLTQLCDMFAFELTCVTKLGDEHNVEIWMNWEMSSARRDVNFIKAKVTTIQNPTIRCFTMFLVKPTIANPGKIKAPNLRITDTKHCSLIKFVTSDQGWEI